MLGSGATSIQPINIYIWNSLWKSFGNFHQGVKFAVTSKTANFELFGLSCLIVRISQRSKKVRRVCAQAVSQGNENQEMHYFAATCNEDDYTLLFYLNYSWPSRKLYFKEI